MSRFTCRTGSVNGTWASTSLIKLMAQTAEGTRQAILYGLEPGIVAIIIGAAQVLVNRTED